MVKTRDIYNMFRRILAEHFRMPKPNEVHVHEIVQCMRKSYYERKYGSSDYSHLSDKKCVILGLGLLTHVKLEELFSQMFNAECEKELRRKVKVNGLIYEVIGTIDILYDNTLIDLKTVNKIPDEPYKHHYLQLQMYMWLANLHKSYIIYICKRDGTIEIFDIIRNERAITHMLERLHYYITCVSADVTPRAEKSYLCNYCEYLLDCGLTNDARKKRRR